MLVPSAEPGPGTPLKIPVVQSCRYLGAQLAYARCAERTLHHNMQVAQQRFNSMRKFLTGRHKLVLTQRVRLWKACILPMLTSTLEVVGVAAADAPRISTFVQKQLRAIARSPAHLTHETNEALHARLAVPDVLCLLHQRASRSLAKLQATSHERSILQDLAIAAHCWFEQARDHSLALCAA